MVETDDQTCSPSLSDQLGSFLGPPALALGGLDEDEVIAGRRCPVLLVVRYIYTVNQSLLAGSVATALSGDLTGSSRVAPAATPSSGTFDSG
jgi:hypothetical protein